jgi:hypothetical protein
MAGSNRCFLLWLHAAAICRISLKSPPSRNKKIQVKEEFFGRSNIPFGGCPALWRGLAFSGWRDASHSIFVVGENGICRGQSGPCVDCKQSGRNQAAQRRPLNEK